MSERSVSIANSARELSSTSPAQSQKLDALMQLSGGMAHDFNNVLQVIQGVVELLRKRTPDADAGTASLIDMLQRNVDRGASLTRTLLGYSGRQPLNQVPLNPNRLIANLADRLRQTLGASVTLQTVLGGGVGWVCAEPDELASAILNLAANGRDAMPKGGTLTLETRNVSSDAEQVAIEVRDTGIGMSSEVLARAFDPYFTTKDPGRGDGLGLSQVYGLVKQLNGQITIESAPGSGTTVTLYLPRLASADVMEMPSEPCQKTGAASSLAGLRVLVVEDESLIGMLVEDLLSQLECRMIGLVSSLDQALDMAGRADIDVALLDVDIGGEPVYPVAAVLQPRGIPFVFMSGCGALEPQWRNRPSVQKPFDLAQLKQQIDRAISRS